MDSIIKALFEQGGLAALLALSAAANIYLLKRVNDIQDKRIDDLKETKDTINDNLTTIKDLQLSIRNSMSLLVQLIEGHLKAKGEVE